MNDDYSASTVGSHTGTLSGIRAIPRSVTSACLEAAGPVNSMQIPVDLVRSWSLDNADAGRIDRSVDLVQVRRASKLSLCDSVEGATQHVMTTSWVVRPSVRRFVNWQETFIKSASHRWFPPLRT